MNKFKIGDRVRCNFRNRSGCFVEIIINELNIQRAALCYGGIIVMNVWKWNTARERIGDRHYEPIEGALHRDWDERLQLVTLDNPAQCRRCLGPAPAESRCTNGHCYACHREWCTDGGATYPGHNVRRAPACAELEEDKKRWAEVDDLFDRSNWPPERRT